MIGQNIKRLRKQAGYSQESLARLLGVTQGAVSQWEKDRTIPDTPFKFVYPFCKAIILCIV